MALAYDTPINGYGTSHTINLRLWKAQPCNVGLLSSFKAGLNVEV